MGEWMGSAPGNMVASQLLRPTGQPEEAPACGGVSDTKSFGSEQPPWNVCDSNSQCPAGYGQRRAGQQYVAQAKPTSTRSSVMQREW